MVLEMMQWIYLLRKRLTMTNSKKYQEFLDYYLAQGYTYIESGKLALKKWQEYYKNLDKD